MEVYFDDFKVEHIKSPVISSQDFYPFGLAHSSYQRENSLANQYQYNGKEQQDELNLGWLDYGARMYSSDIGRFTTADRYSEKYRPISIYQYAANNPLRFVDINGDSIDIYGSDGAHVMTLDDGKKTSSGIYFQKSRTTKNGKTILENPISFGYNDEKNDREDAMEGGVSFKVVGESDIEDAMEKSGVNEPGNKAIGWEYVYRESNGTNRNGRSGGRLDFSKGYSEAKALFIVQSKFGDAVAYNDQDYGNFLWGRAGRKLGFSRPTLSAGAHFNNAWSGKEQNANNPEYEHQFWDSVEDQRAISNGYYYNREPQQNGVYKHSILP